jgi:hypothetical protein
MIAPAPSPARSYDLYLVADGRRFYIRNDDRGVTLDDNGLAWIAGGRADGAPFGNIVEVRMQSGGDWKNALNQCQIRFRDNHLLTVTDGNRYGATDDARTPVYRDFVRDLHARLIAARLAPSIRFIAGYSHGNCMVVLTAAVFMGMLGVATPVVLLLITGKLEALYLLIGGAFMVWPMYTMVSNNKPRGYHPQQPPGELME